MYLSAQLDLESEDLAQLALLAAEDIGQLGRLPQAMQDLATLRATLLPPLLMLPGALRWEALVSRFYGELGFGGDWRAFYTLEHSLLDRVLLRRQGIPVTLGILLIHLARRLGLAVAGICFPGHFLLRLAGELPVYFDPFEGRPLSRAELQLRLRGALGDLAKLEAKHLKPASQREILQRLINVSKSAALAQQAHPEALRSCELLLTLDPDDPYERRDRGFIYEQLDCPHQAAEDFRHFIKHCPADPLADLLKGQVSRLVERPLVIH